MNGFDPISSNTSSFAPKNPCPSLRWRGGGLSFALYYGLSLAGRPGTLLKVVKDWGKILVSMLMHKLSIVGDNLFNWQKCRIRFHVNVTSKVFRVNVKTAAVHIWTFFLQEMHTVYIYHVALFCIANCTGSIFTTFVSHVSIYHTWSNGILAVLQMIIWECQLKKIACRLQMEGGHLQCTARFIII